MSDDEPSRTRFTETSLYGPWLFALCLGLLTGLGEGCLLWLFQNINWRSWGPAIHFSAEIIWSSPLVDVPLFLLFAAVLVLLVRLTGRVLPLSVLAALLTFLTAYDWLSVTGRLHYLAVFFLSTGVAVAAYRRSETDSGNLVVACKAALPVLAGLLILAFVLTTGASHWMENQRMARAPLASPGSPNVLVIVIDTLRADHLSSYGYPTETSPVIDGVARSGVLFENAVSSSSWSLPSHVSLVTGKNVSDHGIANVQPRPLFDSGNSALKGSSTLGEALRQRGYRTAAFSANRTFFATNLGFSDGFTHFEDYFQSFQDRVARTFYGGRLLRLYAKKVNPGVLDRLLRYGRGFGVRKRADVVNREVVRWIDKSSLPDAKNAHPFFVFINYLDVHFPYGGPGVYAESPSEQGREIVNYDKSVTYVDSAVGSLLKDLASRGIDNTIVVITSDHGESLGDHGLQFHGTSLYWELIHVPLIISGPGRIPAGLKVNTPVSNAALASTILQLSGGGSSFPQPGLATLWTDAGAKTLKAEVISELAYDPTGDEANKEAAKVTPTASTGAMKSLLTERWHLIVHQKMGDQLYDRLADPAEQTNLAQTPSMQSIVGELSDKLDSETHSRWLISPNAASKP